MKTHKRHEFTVVIVIFMISSASAINLTGGEGQSQSTATNSMAAFGSELEMPTSTIWQSGIGEGFRSTVKTFSIEPGVALGMKIFGSRQSHNLALISLSYGRMLGAVIGEGHWYCGNPELR